MNNISIFKQQIDLENPSWTIHELRLFATNVEQAQLFYVSR